MLPKSKSIQILKKYFKKNKIATMQELMNLLDTTNRMSIFRRLSDLGYISSYSHKGKYYTLPSLIKFNSVGLYHCNAIGFSQHGNLKKTIIKLVGSSVSGYTHKELEELLNLVVHDTLLLLVNAEQLSRQKINNHYVYLCIDKSRAKKQLSKRQVMGQARKSNSRISKILIIEILVAIIRTKQMNIDIATIISDLKARKIVTTKDEIEQILFQLDLKKTLD
jgi:hypothetical protein